MKRVVFGVMLVLLLIGTPIMFGIRPAEANGDPTIYVRADGSIDPTTAPITTVDNITYTLTNDINGTIVIERDNIVVDGASHALT